MTVEAHDTHPVFLCGPGEIAPSTTVFIPAAAGPGVRGVQFNAASGAADAGGAADEYSTAAYFAGLEERIRLTGERG